MRKFFIYFLTAILLLTTSILSWYLLDSTAETGEVFSTTIVLMIKAGMVLAILLLIILIYQHIRASSDSDDNLSMQTIIEKACDDPDYLRSAIIRLRQIKHPEQMTFAVTLATLLEQQSSIINDVLDEQALQQQQNLSLSRKASDLEDKHEQLIKAPHLRSEFLSRMGDEITLPMNSLGTMLKLLKSMELEVEARDLLIIATHSAHSLIENLTNILEFSKLDAHLLDLDKDYFDLSETISSVLETQESIALAKHLIIETHINPDVPEKIYGEQKSIVKILDNLISNAIRFTDRGHIRLVVDNKSDASRKLLRFTVIDTGIGMPKSALEGLFDSLDKDTDLVTSSFTGRLRLIVSKQLCELMGGEIGVRSTQGEGSQFWFTVDIST